MKYIFEGHNHHLEADIAAATPELTAEEKDMTEMLLRNNVATSKIASIIKEKFGKTVTNKFILNLKLKCDFDEDSNLLEFVKKQSRNGGICHMCMEGE